MLSATEVMNQYKAAVAVRQLWEPHWESCYGYTLPRRSAHSTASDYAEIYDATASDGVDNLAAGLLAHLTPPWSKWLGFKSAAPNADVAQWEQTLHRHLSQSNFTTEIHQCYLDLIIAGTASLLFEEAPLGEPSAFRFKAVPIWDVYLAENTQGELKNTFRRLSLTKGEFKARFPKSRLQPNEEPNVVEAVYHQHHHTRYIAVLASATPRILAKGSFSHSPFINFRWMKALGEPYGRSPVMKALPDIKTANKVVEFILKRASMLAAGMWQVDYDGPDLDQIKLEAGVLIPKGSEGGSITPIEMPANFDVSQLVLEDLRTRIKTALLTNKLSLPEIKMTATEVVERSIETTRIMGAIFGRLQSELLSTLAERAVEILIRRGELPRICRNRSQVAVEFRSPLAQAQRRSEAQNIMTWLEATTALGGDQAELINRKAVVDYLAKLLSVPADITAKLEATSQ